MRVIDTYFDYGSPYAYFVVERLLALARAAGARVVWKPIELARLFGDHSPYTDAKRRYVMHDAVRSAEYHGLPVRMPSPFPVRSAPALRAALAAAEAGVFEAFHRAVFRAAWTEARDIGAEDVLADCARAAGTDPGALLARAAHPEIDARVLALTADAESIGVFGVPTMVLDGELFWGNDRLDMLAWRLGLRAPTAA